jgi:hypothetical protein
VKEKGKTMTEIEIMKDMECCAEHNCDECSRSASITNGCVNRLLKDALGVIKLQKYAVENGNKTIDSLLQKVAEYESSALCRIKMDDVINCVNDIIENSVDDDECGDYVGCLIDSCQKLIKLLKIEDAQVVFGAWNLTPKIQMKQK